MKLYIKRDVHSADSRFIVFDELCREKYFIVSYGKSFDKLKITDTMGNVLTKIKRLPLPLLYAYSITCNKQNFKFILNPARTAQNCYFYGTSFYIAGRVFTKTFNILDVDNSLVATHNRCCKSCSDGYELNILAEENEQSCIAIATCVNLASIAQNPALQTV